jgi:hypothetical protein
MLKDCGAFEGVYEYWGVRCSEFRKTIKFPQTYIPGTNHLKNMVYIDMNGAYMAFVDGIPQRLDADRFLNRRIKDLIDALYKKRLELGNNKIAITIKKMMASIFGRSIIKPKLYKTKYSTDVKKYIETHEPYVCKWNNTSVTTIKPFSPHYQFPQFAKRLLDNFNKFMDDISKIVKVHYYNVDAIMVSEEDYNKLVELGYVGTNLGQFKLTNRFKEVYFKSPRIWMAKTMDGEDFDHTRRKNLTYEAFFELK